MRFQTPGAPRRRGWRWGRGAGTPNPNLAQLGCPGGAESAASAGNTRSSTRFHEPAFRILHEATGAAARSQGRPRPPARPAHRASTLHRARSSRAPSPRPRYQPAGGCWRPLGSQTRTFGSSELPGSCLNPRSGTREAGPGAHRQARAWPLSAGGSGTPRVDSTPLAGGGQGLGGCCPGAAPTPPKPRRLAFAVPAPTLSGCEITKKVGRKGREKGTARRE